MPSINVSEADFCLLHAAANDAKNDGRMQDARGLDKLARKVNAALASGAPGVGIARKVGISTPSIRWQDMPTTLK